MLLSFPPEPAKKLSDYFFVIHVAVEKTKAGKFSKNKWNEVGQQKSMDIGKAKKNNMILQSVEDGMDIT